MEASRECRRNQDGVKRIAVSYKSGEGRSEGRSWDGGGSCCRVAATKEELKSPKNIEVGLPQPRCVTCRNFSSAGNQPCKARDASRTRLLAPAFHLNTI